MLAACASPLPLEAELDADAADNFVSEDVPRTSLDEPRPDEVVVVINNNGGIGNHAGIFVGRRLSDPAGSYRFVRSKLKGWKRPTLNDYVGFQMVDGERVQSYRFTLREPDLSAVAARLPTADAAAPLFCASAVNNALAGIGPFAEIKPVHWVTPAAVAEQLKAIITASPDIGHCVLPDGTACTKPVQVRATVSQ
jgi:hypothetical protein